MGKRLALAVVFVAASFVCLLRYENTHTWKPAVVAVLFASIAMPQLIRIAQDYL